MEGEGKNRVKTMRSRSTAENDQTVAACDNSETIAVKPENLPPPGDPDTTARLTDEL